MAKQASLELSIAVDTGRVKSNLDQVRAAFQTATSGINASLASIKGFIELKKQTEATAKAYGEAQRKVAELAREIKAGTGGAALAKDFERAKTEAGRLKQMLEGQRVELHRLRQTMADGGVDTARLGQSQARLREQLAKNTSAFRDLAKVANARDALGVNRHKEIQAEIVKTKAFYKDLAQSGQASAKEQAQAWVKMQDQVKDLRGQMNGFGQAMGQVKGQLVAAGAGFAAWGAGAVGAVQEAIRFEAAFADVKKVVDGSPEQMAGLSREIIGLGRSLPVAHTGLAQIAAMGGQMGLPVEEIGAFTQAAATMGTAFSIPAEQVGQAVGTLKSIFGLTIPDVVALGDNINVLGDSMATNEAAIIETMTRIGGSVKIFGLAKEKAAALSAAMLELGQSPEVAATSINTLLSKLQAANVQTPQFKAALESIGLSAEQMATLVRTKPQQAIDTLLETLGRLGKQEQAEALTRLFGTEYQDNIALLVQGVDSYRHALAEVEDQTKVLGSTEREAAARNKTTEAQLQLLKNTWAEVALNVGNVFLPALNAVVGVLREVLGGIATLAEKFPGLTLALTLAAGAATVFIAALAARKAIMLAFGGEILGMVAALKNLGPVLADGVKGLNALGDTATTVKGALGSMGALLVAWELGQWAGEILGSFDFVKKGALTLIHTFDLLRLSAQKAWAVLTGGDVEAVNRQIDAAKQAYEGMVAEIDNKPKPVAEQAQAEQQEQPQAQDPVADERAKNLAIIEEREKALQKLGEEEAKALEEKKQREAEAAKLADEERAQAEEQRQQAQAERQRADEERRQRAELVAEPQEAIVSAPDEAMSEPILLGERATQADPTPLDPTEIRRQEEQADTERERRAERAAARQTEREQQAEAASEEREQRTETVRAGMEERRQQAAEAMAKMEQARQEEAERAAEAEAEQARQLQEAQAAAAEARMAKEQQATEQAKSVFERYAERVKTLQDEIAGRERSLKDELAEMDPYADEETKWRRRAAEAKQYEKAAKAAQEAGQLEEAQTLADQARSLYKQLGSGADGIDPKRAKQLAYSGVRSAGQLGLEIAQGLPGQAKQEAKLDLGKLDGLNAQLARLLGGKLETLAAMPGQAPGQDGKPTQVHELRLGKASLQGSPTDISEFIRQLELAGMTA
jgi:TP901 family phage tail tape measure protein